MALVGYYMRLFILVALSYAKSGVVLGLLQFRLIKTSIHGLALKCCLAARVRRYTSATGE